jgi:hypothetical protein
MWQWERLEGHPHWSSLLLLMLLMLRALLLLMQTLTQHGHPASAGGQRVYVCPAESQQLTGVW